MSWQFSGIRGKLRKIAEKEKPEEKQRCNVTFKVLIFVAFSWGAKFSGNEEEIKKVHHVNLKKEA